MRQGFTLIELMIVIAIIAIIAAIAIPNLLESRVTANESAAASTLKSGVFPAMTQWQGGGYEDSDGDNVGEFATLEYLAGVVPGSSGAANINLLQGALAANRLAGATSRTANGYLVLARVPSAAGGSAVDEGTLLTNDPLTGANNDRERFFSVAAAPERWNDTGRRSFMLSQDGQVRSPAGANAAANHLTWSGGAALTDNPSPTVASVIAGLNTAYTTADDLSSAIVVADYPVYTK